MIFTILLKEIVLISSIQSANDWQKISPILYIYVLVTDDVAVNDHFNTTQDRHSILQILEINSLPFIAVQLKSLIKSQGLVRKYISLKWPNHLLEPNVNNHVSEFIELTAAIFAAIVALTADHVVQLTQTSIPPEIKIQFALIAPLIIASIIYNFLNEVVRFTV